MTTYLRDRQPVHRARQYDPALEESSAESLAAWVGDGLSSTEVTVSADAQGFSITLTSGVDGSRTVSGVPGDWIVIVSGTIDPEVIDEETLLRRFEVIP